jgi:hypothetical protein
VCCRPVQVFNAGRRPVCYVVASIEKAVLESCCRLASFYKL